MDDSNDPGDDGGESRTADTRQSIDAERPDGVRVTYMLEERLGSGGGGTVWLAKRVPYEGESSTDSSVRSELVAIKKASDDLQWQNNLVREAKLLHTLRESADERLHAPGHHDWDSRIVRILSSEEPLECISEAGHPPLIELDYLDGDTLRTFLDETWSEVLAEGARTRILSTVCRFVRHLAQAIWELQNAGDRTILHRDVKPQNVMVTGGGGELTLFDFNVAREESSDNLTQGVGTKQYWAPEVFWHQRDEDAIYDQRADLFSVGIVAWELLHGERPSVIGEWKREAMTDAPRYQVDWPSDRYADLDEPVAEKLGELLQGLLCDPERRFESAERVIEVVDEFERRLHGPTTSGHVVGGRDLVELIAELAPNRDASVVADVDREERSALQRYIRDRTRVDDPLEAYLEDRVEAALAADRDGPRLLMLSGNAGDGKSYMIDRLEHAYFAHRPDFERKTEIVADATHAHEPDQSQQDRLEAFFAAFAVDAAGEPVGVFDKELYVIAMNTGMVIRFFEEAMRREDADEVPYRGTLEPIYELLQWQLGLVDPDEIEAPQDYPHGVETINLDLRSMLRSPEGESCFFERMIDQLDPDLEEGFLAPRRNQLERDGAHLCPVTFNLRALQRDAPRRALVRLVRRAELDPEVHLSPRNLWGFLYRLITGGIERYEGEADDADGPIEVIDHHVRDRSEPREESDEIQGTNAHWLMNGMWTELLFEQAKQGGVWEALAELDPAYVTVSELEEIQKALAVDRDWDLDEQALQRLGADDESLCGLSIKKLLNDVPTVEDRRNAAVRRHVFFDNTLLDAYLDSGPGAAFAELLEAYTDYSRDPTQASKRHRNALKRLADDVREAIVRSYGRRIGDEVMLRVSQPNARADEQLMVPVSNRQLDDHFSPGELLRPDPHVRVHADAGRLDLLETLGYRPDTVDLEIGGFELPVDLEMYRFLSRVRDGQQPSALDLAQFQSLRFIAERLGNQIALETDEIYLYEPDDDSLHRLERDYFEDYEIERNVRS
jgi:serine/threonine protein kinase/predicted ATPase